MQISIHAPTRGATLSLVKVFPYLFLFQSTLPREERLLCLCRFCNLKLFQSTLPREERQASSASVSPGSNISIHAPTRGATSYGLHFFCASKISIHAPTRGATLDEASAQLNSRFQSTLPREERRQKKICPDFLRYFNPRSHERSDNNVEISRQMLRRSSRGSVD